MFDIITIGSAAVDAFAETDKKFFKNNSYSYPVGSKLKINDLKFDTGGGGTNTAVSFSRLGLKTAWLGKLGSGANSERVISQLKKEKIDVSLSSKEKGRTGFSIILDSKGHDRTILAFKGSNDHLLIKDVKQQKINTKWIYASSMMGKSFSTLIKIFSLAERKGIKKAFNPSLYLTKLGKTKLRPLLSKTDVLIYNKEEAQELTKGKRLDDLLKKSRRLLKNEGIVVITDGPKGAFAFDGVHKYNIKTHKIKIKETTGAGDAFASTFVACIAKGKNIHFAMKAGIINSESVIQHLGAKNKLLKWGELLNEMKKSRNKVEMEEMR